MLSIQITLSHLASRFIDSNDGIYQSVDNKWLAHIDKWGRKVKKFIWINSELCFSYSKIWKMPLSTGGVCFGFEHPPPPEDLPTDPPGIKGVYTRWNGLSNLMTLFFVFTFKICPADTTWSIKLTALEIVCSHTSDCQLLWFFFFSIATFLQSLSNNVHLYDFAE